jgi:hypothetical protein
MRRRLLFVCLACASAAGAVMAFATLALAPDRWVLREMVRACVADAESLTQKPTILPAALRPGECRPG